MYRAAVLRRSAGLPCIFVECWISPCLLLNIRLQLGHGMIEVPAGGRRGISVKGNKKFINIWRYETLGNALHKLCSRSVHDWDLKRPQGTSDCHITSCNSNKRETGLYDTYQHTCFEQPNRFFQIALHSGIPCYRTCCLVLQSVMKLE